jgi:hypothetical protein
MVKRWSFPSGWVWEKEHWLKKAGGMRIIILRGVIAFNGML